MLKLIVVLFIINIYSISYANTSNIKTECYEQNGIQYKIVYTYIGDKVDISIRTDDSNDILKLERNGKRITVEQLEYQGRTFFGSYKYDENVLYDNMDEDLLKKGMLIQKRTKKKYMMRGSISFGIVKIQLQPLCIIELVV